MERQHKVAWAENTATENAEIDVPVPVQHPKAALNW